MTVERGKLRLSRKQTPDHTSPEGQKPNTAMTAKASQDILYSSTGKQKSTLVSLA
jgi:hypothetical protein